MSNKRIKPKGSVYRHGFKPGIAQFANIDRIEVAAWCPDQKAELPPTQVHLVQYLKDFDVPLVLRFLGPDTMGFLIEELIQYRRIVWPDSQKVKGEE